MGVYRFQRDWTNTGAILVGRVFLKRTACGCPVRQIGTVSSHRYQGDTLWTIECDALISDGNTFRIKKDKKWGWCDNKGNIFIEPRFEDSESFGNPDLAPVKIRGKWGYINRKGEWKIKRQFSKAFPFFDGLAVVQTGTVYGLIDPDGHFQINPQYDRISEDYIHQSIRKGSAFTLVESDHARYK